MVKICNAICQGSDDYREHGWKRKVDMERIGKPCPNPAKKGFDRCPKHLTPEYIIQYALSVGTGYLESIWSKKGGSDDLSNC